MTQVLEPHDHVVTFYDTDQDLTSDVSRFIGEGLRSDEAAIVIATPSHRAQFEDVLAQMADVAEAELSGRYHVLDAAETLQRFMVGGSPDRDRFRASVGALMADLTSAGLPVRAFGEMVALLWEAGNVPAAIELEDLWNDLAREHRFTLHCAYKISALTSRDDLHAATAVCATHSDVVAPRSYMNHGGPAHDGSRVQSRLFVPGMTSMLAARAFVTEALEGWGHAAAVPDATIVVSELATNALRHATSAYRVTIRDGEGTVRIAVEDTDPSAPNRREHAHDGSGGLGLALVDRLSVASGAELSDSGKVVWADLSLTPV